MGTNVAVVTNAATLLDAASGEPLHPAARETFAAALDQGWSDPRRLHREGRRARLLLDNARAVVAECLGLRDDEVAFAPTGTEAVQRGLLGLLEGRAASTRGLVHGAVEHSSVLHTAAWLARREGTGHLSVPVDARGRVDVAAFAEAARSPGIGAAALQSANHEVGTRQPVDDVDLPEGVPLLVDATSTIGRDPLPRQWSVLTAPARAWGGPAGVALMAVRRRVRWGNPWPGDDERDGPGPVDVPAALAAAAALRAVLDEQPERDVRHRRLVDRVRAAAAALPDVEVVGDPVDRAPHLLTFSCLYVDGEALVHALDRRGFAVASGSACTSSTLEPSHVLAAMGALTHGNVRISLPREVHEDQVEAFCAVLPEVLAELRAGLDL